jgi:hypothetical protein
LETLSVVSSEKPKLRRAFSENNYTWVLTANGDIPLLAEQQHTWGIKGGEILKSDESCISNPKSEIANRTV